MKSNLNKKTGGMCLADSSCFFTYLAIAPNVLANQAASISLTFASDSHFELHRIVGTTDADNDFLSIVGDSAVPALPPNIQNSPPNQTLVAPFVEVGTPALRARNVSTQPNNGNHIERNPNNFSVLITLQDTGKQLANTNIPQMILNGVGNLLPMNRPTIFRPQSILIFDFLNLINKTININLALFGVKLYNTGIPKQRR